MSDVKRYTWAYGDVVSANDYDALLADNAALRADAERYRWLKAHNEGNNVEFDMEPTRLSEGWDAAIDAARAGGEQT